jgi:hypothetical protein
MRRQCRLIELRSGEGAFAPLGGSTARVRRDWREEAGLVLGAPWRALRRGLRACVAVRVEVVEEAPMSTWARICGMGVAEGQRKGRGAEKSRFTIHEARFTSTRDGGSRCGDRRSCSTRA